MSNEWHLATEPLCSLISLLLPHTTSRARERVLRAHETDPRARFWWTMIKPTNELGPTSHTSRAKLWRNNAPTSISRAPGAMWRCNRRYLRVTLTAGHADECHRCIADHRRRPSTNPSTLQSAPQGLASTLAAFTVSSRHIEHSSPAEENSRTHRRVLIVAQDRAQAPNDHGIPGRVQLSLHRRTAVYSSFRRHPARSASAKSFCATTRAHSSYAGPG